MEKEDEIGSVNEQVGQIQKVFPKASGLTWVISRESGIKLSCEEEKVSKNQTVNTVHNLCNRK